MNEFIIVIIIVTVGSILLRRFYKIRSKSDSTLTINEHPSNYTKQAMEMIDERKKTEQKKPTTNISEN